MSFSKFFNIFIGLILSIVFSMGVFAAGVENSTKNGKKAIPTIKAHSIQDLNEALSRQQESSRNLPKRLESSPPSEDSQDEYGTQSIRRLVRITSNKNEYLNQRHVHEKFLNNKFINDYAHGWKNKVEESMNQKLRETSKNQFSPNEFTGDLIVFADVFANGNLEKIETAGTFGNKFLDKYLLDSVKGSFPHLPFTRDMKSIDILMISTTSTCNIINDSLKCFIR